MATKKKAAPAATGAGMQLDMFLEIAGIKP